MKNLNLALITITLFGLNACVTTGNPGSDQYIYTQAVPPGQPNLVSSASGYYNPPATGYVRGTQHNLGNNVSFNGQPVLSSQNSGMAIISQPPVDITSPREAIQWNREAHYQQMDISREQQQWYRLAMQQQAQDHREAIDRARQQQQEIRDYTRVFQGVSREALRWTSGSRW